MKNCFSVYYNNTEILLAKKDVNFVDGYGVIRPVYSFDMEEDKIFMPLIGIVDQNYQVIANLYSQEDMPKIDLFLKGNFIYKLNVDGEVAVFQGLLENGEFKIYHDLEAMDYKVINDKIIKLTALVDGFQMYALYNVLDMQVSDYYNYISDFKYNDTYQKEIAEAAYLVIDEEGNVLDIIKVIIDLEGNKLTSFKDGKFNLEANSLEEMQELIKAKLGVLTR